MVTKATGYSGFQTYGQLSYPTTKQGKQLQILNNVWSDTHREKDQSKMLENFDTTKTIYKRMLLENTKPEDYHIKHVKKGQHRTLDFGNSKGVAFDALEAQKYGELGTIEEKDRESQDSAKRQLLITGVEHWKSNYQGMNLGRDHANNNNNAISTSFVRNSSNNQRNKQSENKFGEILPIINPNNSSLRSQSFQQSSKPTSWKNHAYLNSSKLGSSQYKFNYGQKIGSAPTDLMNGLSYSQPIQNNPLKYGSNQLWSQIPNYQGFKPSAVGFKEYEKRIKERSNRDRGDPKLNLTENYHRNIPGYCGYKPKFQNQGVGRERESCFGGLSIN